MPLNRLNKLYSSIVRGGEKRGRPTKNIPFGYSNTEWLLLTAELQDLRTKNAISQQFMAIILDTTQNKISDFENSKLYNEDMVLQYTLLFVDKPINFLCENAYIGLCCKKDDLINKIKIKSTQLQSNDEIYADIQYRIFFRN